MIMMMITMKNMLPGVLLVLNISQGLTPVFRVVLLLPGSGHVLDVPDIVKYDDLIDEVCVNKKDKC